MSKQANSNTNSRSQRALLRYAAICALGPYLLATTALLLFRPGLLS